jgi:hypothetical protein
MYYLVSSETTITMDPWSSSYCSCKWRYLCTIR